MKKISVIVPMYNSEAYIGQCIASVAGQTYRNMEILIIDDGSSDRSREICQRLQEEDRRIRLLIQEHGGVSSARNRGLDEAKGEYIFFIDSDDMIHPLLLEELAGYMERSKADLAFCTYKRADEKELEGAFRELSGRRDRGEWESAEAGEDALAFYKAHSAELLGIGGKLIRKGAIGRLRFDAGLERGEDTLFLHELFCQRKRVGCYHRDWYLYRMRTDSLVHSGRIKSGQYVEACIKVKNNEYENGRIGFAFVLENSIFYMMKRDYTEARRKKEKQKCREIRKRAAKEQRHPMYKRLPLITRCIIRCCFYCHPLYALASPLLYRERGKRGRAKAAGILTFHCSDNYGAMLQAYGLKHCLRSMGIRADIIRYEPFFMTGRHWWIPYIPSGGPGRILSRGLGGWKTNLSAGADFFRQRAKMRSFRRKYLIDGERRRLRFAGELKRLPYRYYVVGSDQIWNPDITLGLREAYFGAFRTKGEKRVIAYGASLGGSSLKPRYDRKFGELLRHVDAVSVREAEAVPYVKRFYPGEVTAVLDPVFLAGKEVWRRLEKETGKERFIFVYMTEPNRALADYAGKLAKDRKMQVIGIKVWKEKTEDWFWADRTAGPAEFLGYMEKADYVVTNSFHGAAFSIIFRKKFIVFRHGSLGARIENILRLHGLEDWLYERCPERDIDMPADWEQVEKRRKGHVKISEQFLMRNLAGMTGRDNPEG